MKNYYLFIFVMQCIITNAQIVTIPDSNFKAKLLQADEFNGIAVDITGNYISIDANNDNEIDETEVFNVYQLNIGFASISSLSGIEYFENLIFLTCYFNDLTVLPVANLQNLVGINCDNNNLTSLNEIQNSVNLQELSFSFNPITEVDLSNLNNLRKISCTNTLLTTLNLCGTQTRWLWCYDNPYLESLYLKNSVISPILARISGSSTNVIPPPLHNFEFSNTPLLNYVCYDEGELDAIQYTIGNNVLNITLTTNCTTACANLDSTTNNKDLLTIYPNPTSDFLNINNLNSSESTVTIYSILGQKLSSINNTSINNTSIIDVSALYAGTYFITIESASSSVTRKFIKL